MPSYRAPILLGLSQTYPDDPSIAALVLAHLRLPRAPLGSQICQFWFSRSAEPVALLEILLSAMDASRGSGASSSLVWAAGFALARNQTRLFDLMQSLTPERQKTTIFLLRRGVAIADGAAQALLDRVDSWPPAHTGALLRTLLESKLQTSAFQEKLCTWLNLHDTYPKPGYREVLIGLVDHPGRFSQLQRYLSNAVKLMVLRERQLREG